MSINPYDGVRLDTMINSDVTMKLTLANVKAALAKIHMTISKRDGEYRVNFRGRGEPTAYYTTDLRDALDTARSMHNAWIIRTSIRSSN